MKPKADATHLVNLLCERHSGDFCVPECKDGASQSRSHRRLDLWVLARTWSPMTTIGYEVKVSRHDFIQDQKLTEYLECCHQFSLVVPKGLIAVEELPADIGLMEAIGPNGGTRLITRRKATHRKTSDLPRLLNLLVYVLMARATEKRSEQNYDRASALRAYLERKDANRTLGGLVSARLVQERYDMRHKIDALEGRVRGFERLEAKLRALGIDPTAYSAEWQLERALRKDSAIKAIEAITRIQTAATEAHLALSRPTPRERDPGSDDQ